MNQDTITASAAPTPAARWRAARILFLVTAAIVAMPVILIVLMARVQERRP